MVYDFGLVDENYLEHLVEFLHTIKWMFCTLNTQYIKAGTIADNQKYLEFCHLELSNATSSSFRISYPCHLQKLLQDVNKFQIQFEKISCSLPAKLPKKMSIKKQYEIENFSNVINAICKDNSTRLIDFGCGLGYLTQHLHKVYGYKIIGLESGKELVETAIKRQLNNYPESIGKVKYVQHFVTNASENFILDQIEENDKNLAIFGLHGCGCLTISAIKLFLTMSRVKKLIFMSCCYHKMTPKDNNYSEFNNFPLSQELCKLLGKYEDFLNRPFLRLAGQQSPSKFFEEMTASDHWIHGKNMFERALVEAMLSENEISKRISSTSIPDGLVTYDDITSKYRLLDKVDGTSKEWNEHHQKTFNILRAAYANGEKMSENLFYLQTIIQSVCENLILIDRIRFIQEQSKLMGIRTNISVKKLENDKLSPRCLILIAEKI